MNCAFDELGTADFFAFALDSGYKGRVGMRWVNLMIGRTSVWAGYLDRMNGELCPWRRSLQDR